MSKKNEAVKSQPGISLHIVKYPVGDHKQIEKGVRSKDIAELTMKYDGEMIDELHISTVMHSKKDIDNLIKLLEVHKHCFWRHETGPSAAAGEPVTVKITKDNHGRRRQK